MMSPVGGVGINYAIQDAVVAANVLAEPLKESQGQLKSWTQGIWLRCSAGACQPVSSR